MEQEPAQRTATENLTTEELVALNNVYDAAEAERLGALPADITQKEWDLVQWRVWDTHRAITDLEKHLKPALESIASGQFSIGSLLFGGKNKR